MSNGTPTPPPARTPPPDVAAMLELERAERAGDRSIVRIGVMTAHLVSCALYGALGIPGVPGRIVDAGHAMRRLIRHGHDEAGVGSVVQVLYEDLPTGGGPIPEQYLRFIEELQDDERRGSYVELSLGPWTRFATVSLLQLALRLEENEIIDEVARQLAEPFTGLARDVLRAGFDRSQDLTREQFLAQRAEGEHLMSVGLGPDDILDLVNAASPVCPRCGQNPALALPGGQQALCANDDCSVLMWNPQQRPEEFEATAETQVFVRDDTGAVRNVRADQVPPGAEIIDLADYFGFTSPVVPEDVDEQAREQERGQPEHD